MRTLRFIVDNDVIKRDSTSDFSNLSKETHVQIEFMFSNEWDGFVKVAGFRRGRDELDPRTLLHGTTCDVPIEALKGTFFRMYVIGKKGEQRLSTKQILISTNE